MSKDSDDFEISRIMAFEYAAEALLTNELYFSRPSAWDDPYEEQNDTIGDIQIFAQCWCGTGYSDAMWRIFGQSNLPINRGPKIQIRCRKGDLVAAIDAAAKATIGVQTEARFVNYIRSTDFKNQFNALPPLDRLFTKRTAFQHEKEFRIALLAAPNWPLLKNASHAGVSLPLQTPLKDLITRIYIDPFATPELVTAIKDYFQKLGLRCWPSKMYKIPK